MIYYSKILIQLFEDLADGKITTKMFVVLVWLYRRADFYSGVVKKVSAARVLSEMFADDREDGRPTERTVQELLYRLRECRYFTSHHVQGVRGSYSVTLNNFPAVKRNDDGTTAIILLRPTETLDWHDLPKKRRGDSEVDVCADASDDTSSDGSGDASAYTELSSLSGISELSQFEVDCIEPNDTASPDTRPTEMGGDGTGEFSTVGVGLPAKPNAMGLDVPVQSEAVASPLPEIAAPPASVNLKDEDTAFLKKWFPFYKPTPEAPAQLGSIRELLGDRLDAYMTWLRSAHRPEKFRCNRWSKFVDATLSEDESSAPVQFTQHKSLNCSVCKALRMWLDKEPKPLPKEKPSKGAAVNDPKYRVDKSKYKCEKPIADTVKAGRKVFNPHEDVYNEPQERKAFILCGECFEMPCTCPPKRKVFEVEEDEL